MGKDMKLSDRQRGTLVGLAIGDALGAAIKFKRPGTFAQVTDYRGGGPHDLAPGEPSISIADFAVPEQRLAIYIGGAAFNVGQRLRRGRFRCDRLRNDTQTEPVAPMNSKRK
jgi:hypothetical protein